MSRRDISAPHDTRNARFYNRVEKREIFGTHSRAREKFHVSISICLKMLARSQLGSNVVFAKGNENLCLTRY